MWSCSDQKSAAAGLIAPDSVSLSHDAENSRRHDPGPTSSFSSPRVAADSAHDVVRWGISMASTKSWRGACTLRRDSSLVLPRGEENYS